MKTTATALVSILISIQSWASGAPAATKWSLRYMARASNALLVANDQALEGQPIICGIEKTETQALSMNLKKLIDEKIKILAPSQKEQLFQLAETCELDCTCDVYSLALEANADKNPKAGKLMDLVNVKGKRVEPKDRMACFQKFQSFCKSHLLKELR